MRVEDEEANWFGNLFNWWIFQLIGYIFGYYFGFITVILGAPTWYYDTMTSLALTPPGASEGWSKTFN